MKKILLVLFLFAVSNLAVRAESFMQKAIDSWVGYSIDDVIDAWGFPTDEKEIAGRKLIYWKNIMTLSEIKNTVLDIKEQTEILRGYL